MSKFLSDALNEFVNDYGQLFMVFVYRQSKIS